ncbi:hypothetical protein EK21DRAFT_115366 [Setomelanomma holmii]|uniref:Uncharacterized protein n=1 Tax=Setomelanomma holmii TaxID=210430 RepID=A0A9P4LJQ8_9PLEO|nr:hypothetical protein EK21DRAFT_115366 [Setomelanomma holmii]
MADAGPKPMVQWQMDIPALTLLFVKAGAHGLKQIALAGVDVHTIGALLTLGNLVPASVEFRRKLDVCRTEQRRSQSWIYKTIEIGAATNFLADELLKTRAGENALALFTAVMPVLAESAYTDAILHLFASSRIEADTTPGIGQLLRLRHSLLPFTDAMGLKNKIMQYHLLFRKYASSNQEPYNAIPGPVTMSKLIQAFRCIEMHGEVHKLIYRGLQGAAWTATYAWEILRLGVCMIVPSPDGDIQVPISESLDKAQVVLYIADLTSEGIELCKDGAVEELIQRTTISATDIEWTIDCDAINFLSSQHPEVAANEKLCRKLSEFVAAKTLDSVAALSGELTYSVNTKRNKYSVPPTLRSYQDHILPSVQKRSITILILLGFLPPGWEEFEFAEHGFTTGIRRQYESQPDATTSCWSWMESPSGLAWWSDKLDRLVVQELQHWLHDASLSNGSAIRPVHILNTVKNAVLFASLLSFTDWHISLRRISASFFNAAVLRQGGSTLNINQINNMQMIQQFCTAHPLPEPLFWSLGQELNGVVLLRHVLLSQNLLDIDGIVIRFAPGRIVFGGETCSEIAASPHGLANDAGRLPAQQQKYHPASLSESIKLSTESHIAGSIVYVNLSAYHTPENQNRPSLPQVIRIRSELVAEVLSNMLVTLPCTHDYYAPLSCAERKLWCWNEGLLFSSNEVTLISKEDGQPKVDLRKDSLELMGSAPRDGTTVYYQTVHGNGLYQWLACHFASEHHLLCVMQHKACVTCTMAAVKTFIEQHPHIQELDVCIVTE